MPSTADAYDARLALGAPAGLLREFNAIGVLSAADVHVAARLGEKAGEADDSVLLACALAVRAPRIGHVHVDLATIRETAAVESTDEPVDLSALPWPDPGEWVGRVATSPLVSHGPLHLDASWLYLDRYWCLERRLAEDLLALNGATDAKGADPPPSDEQERAAQLALRRRLTIVAGGPGTGKTTTVARILARLYEQGGDPHVALAAPTGKAQARLQEAVRAEAERMDVDPGVRERILAIEARTLHRLLGQWPGSGRSRHHRGLRLPHDVVIVDECSMVSLSQMARLAEAIRPDARLILVGDPGQLASVEAGAVLGDIVGAATGPLGDGIVVLEHVHRFKGAIATLAEAIHAGDADAAMAVLSAGHADVVWLADEEPDLRAEAASAARAVHEAAAAGDAAAALHALGAFRILCAHRREVAAWTERIEQWLEVDTLDRDYVGRPLLVTANDYELRLFNGDAGVIVADGERNLAAFERDVRVSPTRLGAVETAYAMTIHKSQGSQFRTAAVLLPEPTARILTRELLYTAATRAQEKLILAGSEEAIRAAIGRPIARASGLSARLSD